MWRLGSPANSDRILGRVAPAQINAIGKWGLRARARANPSRVVVTGGGNVIAVRPSCS
jgi:hypothetical protein